MKHARIFTCYLLFVCMLKFHTPHISIMLLWFILFLCACYNCSKLSNMNLTGNIPSDLVKLTGLVEL